MGADLPGRQTLGVQGQNNLIDIGQPALSFPETMTGTNVPSRSKGHIDLEVLGGVGQQGLGTLCDAPSTSSPTGFQSARRTGPYVIVRLTAMISRMDVNALRVEAKQMQGRFLVAQRMWSFAYHGSAFGAALLAATTTILAAIGAGALPTAVTAAVATVLSSMSAVGNFDQKWITARRSRGGVESVLSDFNSVSPDYEAMRLRLVRINEEHDAALIKAMRGSVLRRDTGKVG